MLKAKNYAVRYALLLSAFTALLFAFVSYEYALLIKETEEAKTEAELVTQAKRIRLEMDRFDPATEKFFYFPRYKLYKAALLKQNGEIIFSTMDFTPQNSVGYYAEHNQRYVVYKLPSGVYFGADALAVSKDFYESEIYFRLSVFLLFAVSALFVVYLYLIKLFERPFVRVNENLDKFIKDSIHEINTPLAIISANVELFCMKHGENKHLARIKAAAKSLSNLYNDMEYLIKRQKALLPKESVDLADAMRARVEYFDEIAKLKGIELVATLEDGLVANLNKTKLYRLIDNNLSNAVKYSHENSKIEARVWRVSEDRACISIKDYGIGIENPQKIFERYYREELSKGGFGLGLNIVKNICDDEGIDVEVVSKVDEGSEFRYIFCVERK